MTVPLYPLMLEPLLKERIWGGDSLVALHRLEGRGVERGATPFGESWLLCDDNVVSNGALRGKRVVEVVAEWGEDLLGSANLASYGTKLALMAKFLDAADDLSIQVHPDDAYAREHEAHTGHLGKSEAWYVLAAAPGAEVVWGFNRTVSADEVRTAVADGSLDELLNRVPVAPGDVIVNPAGTVHAVGAGLLLFEIQQSSDLTYRLYDYGRRDPAGNLRELHVDKALAVADLARADPAQARGTGSNHGGSTGPTPGSTAWRPLVATPQFTLHGTRVEGALDCSTSAESFDLLVLVTGGVSLVAGDGSEAITLERGDAALLPAALGQYRLAGTGEVLRSRVASGVDV